MHAPDRPELFRPFLENLPAAVSMLDCQMRYLAVSRQWLIAHSLENQNLINRSHNEVFPHLPPSWQETYTKTLAGITQAYEAEFQAKSDGCINWIKWEVQPWRHPNGEIGGAILLATPISEPSALRQDSDRLDLQQIDRFFNLSVDMLGIAGFDGYFHRVNPAFEKILGYSTEEFQSQLFVDFVHPEDRDDTLNEVQKIASGATTLSFENRYRCKDGSYKWIAWTAVPFLPEGVFYAVGRDITESKQAESLAIGQKRVLEMIATGKSLPEVLENLTLTIEEQSSGTICSILLLDENEKNLRLGAAPSLPESYNRAIDGGAIGADVASGGTSAYLHQPVIVTDIASDPLWENYRDLALSHQLRACWSAPIFSTSGNVLGTFATYYRQPKSPSPQDWHLVEIATHIAGIAIESKRKEEALYQSELRFQKVVANVPGMIYQYRLTADGIASFTYISPGCRELYEVEPEVLQQAADSGFVHPDDSAVFVDSVVESARTLQPWNQQYRIVTPSKKVKWVQASSRPEKQANGDIVWDGLVIDITEGKLAEEALSQSEANLAEAQQLAHVGSWTFDMATQTLSWTDELFRIFGLEPNRPAPTFSELLLEMIHPDDREFWQTQVEQSMSERKPSAFEHRLIRPDGSIRYLDTQGKPLFDRDGQLIKMFGTAIDITERKTAEIALKQYQEHLEELVAERTAALEATNEQMLEEISERRQAEEALRKKEMQLRRCLSTAKMGVWMWNFKTGKTGDSEGADLLFGRLPGTINSFESFINCLHPEDRDSLIQVIQSAIDGQTNFEIDYRIVWPDGTIRWIAANGDVLRDETGSVVGIAGTVLDITDRKLSEEVLRQSEAREREKAAQLEQTLQELQLTQSHLIQTEKMSSLGQLVAGVAHEINNPVNFIYGNLIYANDYTRDLLRLVLLYQQHYPNPIGEIQEKIASTDLDFIVEDLPRLLSSMKAGAERIREIVLSLRNFSRLDESDRKKVNIHEGIDSTLMILQNRLKSKPDSPGIEIIKEYGNLPLLECYPGQLNQVFMNILSNAIDALEECLDSGDRLMCNGLETASEQLPIVRIGTEVLNSGWIAVKIADNGPGMNEQVRRKLFDPFFTTKPVGKGTGLGLAISYQIVVEKHGGNLYCNSQPGVGTEFVIEIPMGNG